MRVLIQRVSHAAVTIDHKIVDQIDTGLLVFLGVESKDTIEDIDWLTGKIARLRVFRDQAGAMNCSMQDIDGEILVVSQFTLFASTKKGNRPSFIHAAAPEFAARMYLLFCQALETILEKSVHRGIFGARMFVELVNDGPVTIWIDSKNRE